MNQRFRVTIWGARGGYPLGTPGGSRYGGSTPSIEINAGPHTLILDAGTGIVALGRDLLRRQLGAGRRPRATVLLTHFHHDHTQGYPFFSPAFVPGAEITLIAPAFHEYEPGEHLRALMTPPLFPIRFDDLRANHDLRGVQDGETILIRPNGRVELVPPFAGPPETGGLLVRTLRSYAHPGDVMFYRIEWAERAVVYATDTEGYVGADERLVAFARGADLLIHDAQYCQEHYRGALSGFPPTQGWGHSTPEMAAEVARAAGVGQLLLFHHAPEYDDARIDGMEQVARRAFPASRAAQEGMMIDLIASARTLPLSIAG